MEDFAWVDYGQPSDEAEFWEEADRQARRDLWQAIGIMTVIFLAALAWAALILAWVLL